MLYSLLSYIIYWPICRHSKLRGLNILYLDYVYLINDLYYTTVGCIQYTLQIISPIEYIGYAVHTVCA